MYLKDVLKVRSCYGALERKLQIDWRHAGVDDRKRQIFTLSCSHLLLNAF